MRTIDGPKFMWHGKSKLVNLAENIDFRLIPEEMINEKLIGFNNLRTVAILEKMIKISKSVVHLTLPGKGVATGFMISPDVLMTNNHVFGSVTDARDAIVRFNYQIDLSGKFLDVEEYKTDVSFFYTSSKLDYSIVRVDGSPGVKWGYIQLSTDDVVNVQEDVFIIQHPGGEHKQIALSDNQIAYVDETVVQYLTDTLPGSSGSPVFNDSMHLIALHHSGGHIFEPSTTSQYFRNEGIRISAIARDMPKLI